MLVMYPSLRCNAADDVFDEEKHQQLCNVASCDGTTGNVSAEMFRCAAMVRELFRPRFTQSHYHLG